MNNESTEIIFCWYQREEWEKLKAAVDDPNTLDNTYDDWRKSAESAFSEIRSEGHTIKKIGIKVDKLLDWCRANNCKPDSDKRSEYAIYLARLRIN